MASVVSRIICSHNKIFAGGNSTMIAQQSPKRGNSKKIEQLSPAGGNPTKIKQPGFTGRQFDKACIWEGKSTKPAQPSFTDGRSRQRLHRRDFQARSL